MKLSELESAFLFYQHKDTKRWQINETSQIIETTDRVEGGYFVRLLLPRESWKDLGVMTESELVEWIEGQ